MFDSSKAQIDKEMALVMLDTLVIYNKDKGLIYPIVLDAFKQFANETNASYRLQRQSLKVLHRFIGEDQQINLVSGSECIRDLIKIFSVEDHQVPSIKLMSLRTIMSLCDRTEDVRPVVHREGLMDFIVNICTDDSEDMNIRGCALKLLGTLLKDPQNRDDAAHLGIFPHLFRHLTQRSELTHEAVYCLTKLAENPAIGKNLSQPPHVRVLLNILEDDWELPWLKANALSLITTASGHPECRRDLIANGVLKFLRKTYWENLEQVYLKSYALINLLVPTLDTTTKDQYRMLT